MKKLLLFIIIVILAMVGAVGAADLKWNTSTGQVDGYTVYFNGFDYNAGLDTEVLDIDDTLNLHPTTTYTFTVTAWNIMGESGPSNTAEYTTADVYVPPVNNLPIRISKPSIITIIIE
jgi:hypothetical protein